MSIKLFNIISNVLVSIANIVLILFIYNFIISISTCNNYFIYILPFLFLLISNVYFTYVNMFSINIAKKYHNAIDNGIVDIELYYLDSPPNKSKKYSLMILEVFIVALLFYIYIAKSLFIHNTIELWRAITYTIITAFVVYSCCNGIRTGVNINSYIDISEYMLTNNFDEEDDNV